MDKIVSMLKDIGASDELAQAISEELKRYDEEVENKYRTAYNTKLQKAKHVCVEEVENYKVDLANKVSLFLESKTSHIEKRVEQQKAIEEGRAVSKLRSVREITEDIEVASDAEIKALKQKLESLEERANTLAEEKKRAEVAANRANEMALKVIREAKAQQVIVKNDKPAIKEEAETDEEEEIEGEENNEENKDKMPPALLKKMKDKQKKSKAVSEGIRRRKVRAAKPKTTHSTLVERKVLKKGDRHIAEIASAIDVI